jgi:hypothetical protein
VVGQLGGVGDRFAVLAYVRQGAGEQVGVALLAEAEDHRGAHIKGVTVTVKLKDKVISAC